MCTEKSVGLATECQLLLLFLIFCSSSQAAALEVERPLAGDGTVEQLGRRGRRARVLCKLALRSARPARASSEANEGLQLCSLDQLGS